MSISCVVVRQRATAVTVYHAEARRGPARPGSSPLTRLSGADDTARPIDQSPPMDSLRRLPL